MANGNGNKLRVYLRGAYDSYNFGDDLILITVLEFLANGLRLPLDALDIYLQRRSGSLSVLGFSPPFEVHWYTDPIECILRWPGQHGRMPRLIRRVVKGLGFVLLVVEAALWKWGAQSAFFGSHFARLTSMDIVYYVGGGYITDKFLLRLIVEAAFVWLVKTLRPDVVIIGTGLGIGPFSTTIGRWLARSIVRRFSYLATREEESLKLVQRLAPETRARCLGDDVLLLSPLVAELKEPTQRRIAFNMKEFADHRYTESVVEYLVSFLTTRAASPGSAPRRVTFFSFGQYPGPDDQSLLEGRATAVLKSLVADSMSPYVVGWRRFVAELVQSEEGIGFAYHFIVLMGIAGRPCTAVYAGDYYRQKISGACKLLGMRPPLDAARLPLLGSVTKPPMENDEEIVSTREARLVEVHQLYDTMAAEYSRLWSALLGFKATANS